MRKNRFKWRSFYDSSGWNIERVIDCRIVGIGPGRRIYEFPAEPDEAAYLYVTMDMAQSVERRDRRYNEGYYLGEHHGNVSWIIIDVANDKWSYVQSGKVVNFPPRYRYTQEHRDQIYRAAGPFVDALIGDQV